ncbi:MAG: hypothetical protein WC289_05095 [Patescibacteria group bacterium]
MTNTFTITKKIHRMLMLMIMTIGLFMAATGLLLRYQSFTSEYFPLLSLGQIRFLHNKLSVYFAIILILMIITGLWMYFYPVVTRHRHHKQPPHEIPPLE